ncbi:N-ethylmaleimide reductase [Mucilaginibacter mallensis]|uniref:N-ethylmaleimide reductase n=1 Tax=Mucilaginibacter mallensis TaxID=652787 RepID=A0A1H2CD47_MUCMA|nr:alkene reductase [Mucilaginibacter mallensis]SDT68254.1 N-ethylmaleimide reductase [Mucilaginibacter mallensis]
MENILLTPYNRNGLNLKNHLVMAPMTRSRAIDNIPNDLMAEYYGQRNSAGLIITEGTSPTPESLGYPRIPGLFSKEQVEGWKKITEAVHAGGSRIFVQLMHTGRIGHEDNLPRGLHLVSSAAVKAAGPIFTDTKGIQENSEPIALTTEGIKDVIKGHVTAAKNAMAAGFDGIELHGANGYLIEQFLNPNLNNRTDEYGGSVQARAKFVTNLAREIGDAIGYEKVGIRFSPFSTMGDLKAYAEDEVINTYKYLAQELGKLKIAYIHIGLSPAVKDDFLSQLKDAFGGTLIICNGLTPETAEKALESGKAELAAFGRSFLANPDLPERIAENANLNQPDMSALYTPGSRGYTDYKPLQVTV